MSNVVSDNLHKLVKSLTKAEKRYFKVFSSRHIIGDHNNYEILFDAIDKQEVYDEDKLLRKFKDKAFTQRFSISKNRLYSAILKSLDSFHGESSVQAQLHKQLHAIEILYHKSLYDQCAKLLNSARKMAESNECFLVLMEIQRWEKRILERDHYESNPSAQELEDLAARDHRLMQQIDAYNQLWQAKSTIFTHIYRQGKVREASQLEQLQKALDQVSAILQWAPESTEIQYQSNHIHSAFHFANGDYRNCYVFLQRNLQLINDKKELFTSDPSIYLSVLSNAVHVAMRLGKWDEALDWSNKMNELPSFLDITPSEDLEIKIFAIAMSSQLTIHAQKGDFEMATLLVPQLEFGLKKMDERISSVRRAQLYFNIAVILFGADKMSEALKYINKLLNQVDIDKSKDIHCMAQIFNLVIHLELGNTELLPYALRSTQRFLETRSRNFAFEAIILDFVNECLKKRQSRTQSEMYGQLATDLKALLDNPYERSVFEYFDFLSWAKSKQEGKKFKEMVMA
jgi:hypothetical protein